MRPLIGPLRRCEHCGVVPRDWGKHEATVGHVRRVKYAERDRLMRDYQALLDAGWEPVSDGASAILAAGVEVRRVRFRTMRKVSRYDRWVDTDGTTLLSPWWAARVQGAPLSFADRRLLIGYLGDHEEARIELEVACGRRAARAQDDLLSRYLGGLARALDRGPRGPGDREGGGPE